MTLQVKPLLLRVLIEVLVLWTIGALFTGCSSTMFPVNVNAEQSAKDEEHAVYGAAIKAMYVRDQTNSIAIEDHTLPKSSLSDDWGKESEYVVRHMPVVSQEVLNDFQSKNEQSHQLESSFRLNVEYFLIDKEESKEIYQEGSGWNNFYTKHPKAEGLIRLSKVGFSRDFKEALLYIRNQSSYNNGKGFYVLLIKEGELWIIRTKYLWEVS